jgi:hypothetical protein
MSQYVTVEQYAVSRGEDPDLYSELRTAQINAKLTEASNLVDVWVRPVEIDPADVTDEGPLGALIPIIMKMTSRGLINPNEYTGEQFADYSYQAQGTINATRGERRLVRRVVGIPSASDMDMEQYVNIPPIGINGLEDVI